jgi:serine/threonine protein kinase
LFLDRSPLSTRVFPVRKETLRMADRIGQQLGNYHLLRKIGAGAFAEVYLGEHLYLERPAAIKVLHVQLGLQTQEQFRREARTIAHLQHPHIVQVLDFGIHDQTPYLVMEYTPGHSPSSRRRFLRRVRAFWIDGVLEHSLHGAALIALGLQEQRDALANPWHLVLHYPASPASGLPLLG